MKNLIFIGMPAVGKSTVGVVVAKRLGMEFIDTDLLIQKQEGRLLREIIADVGEDGFLAIENQVNCQVNAERAVISPGGSVVYCEEAMKHFKEIGTVVYLKVQEKIDAEVDAQVKEKINAEVESAVEITKKESTKATEKRINALIIALSKADRMEDIIKAAKDHDYQQNLFKEFGL